MSELPEGWARTSIETICSAVPKVDPRAEPGASFAYIDISGVDGDAGRIVATQHLLGADAPSRARQLVADGDVVVSTVRTYMRKSALVPAELDGGVASTGFAVLRPNDAIAPSLLLHAVRHPDFVERLSSQQTGSSYPAVRDRDVREMEVALPPRSEQERIVTAIEEAFSKLDAGEAGLRTVRQLLKRVREAVLAAAVTGRLAPQDPTDTPANKLLADLGVPPAPGMYEVPDSWRWARLGSMLREPMRNGMSAVKADRSDGLPTFSITAVTTGDFSEQNIKYTAGDWSRASDLWAEAGDLFVQRSNTPELVGTARLYRGEPRAAIFPDLLIRVRAVDQLRPEWLELFMGSPRCRAFVRSQAKGLAGSMPKISQPVLDRLEVPVPPEDEQDRIIAEVERQMSFVEACERAVDVGLARAAALRRSVLKAAFEGRLVAQDPSDEPASVLLERIRADRAEGGVGSGGHRRRKVESS